MDQIAQLASTLKTILWEKCNSINDDKKGGTRPLEIKSQNLDSISIPCPLTYDKQHEYALHNIRLVFLGFNLNIPSPNVHNQG